jgi:hypothetical protein
MVRPVLVIYKVTLRWIERIVAQMNDVRTLLTGRGWWSRRAGTVTGSISPSPTPAPSAS